jgi:hypothetical protein
MMEKVRRAQRQVRKLSELVSQLLDISRIDRGRLELKREPLDLAVLVREVVGRVRPMLEGAGCEIRLNLEEGVVGTWDSTRLDQVLMNLIGNGGLGLGLWITRGIVQEHGGSICVLSRPGAGATFVVELPLGHPLREEEQVNPEPAPPDGDASPPRAPPLPGEHCTEPGEDLGPARLPSLLIARRTRHVPAVSSGSARGTSGHRLDSVSSSSLS